MNKRISDTIKNFEKRNIRAAYFEKLEDVKKEILELILPEDTVGIGNSITIKATGIGFELEKRGNPVFDKTKAMDKAESKSLKMKAMFADWYLLSCNAISLQGQLVNIDHTGNRVAAMIYGPERVIVVASVCKIEDNLEDAISRAKNVSAPSNARRAGLNPPCVALNHCVDCYSNERVCNTLVVMEGQTNFERLRVFLVGEKVGF